MSPWRQGRLLAVDATGLLQVKGCLGFVALAVPGHQPVRDPRGLQQPNAASDVYMAGSLCTSVLSIEMMLLFCRASSADVV